MIHIYTGKGKGKTTSAFGLAMRARGQGLNVIIFQFLKPESFISGEGIFIKKTKGIKLIKFNQTHPMFKSSYRPLQKLKRTIRNDFEIARMTILSGKYDLVILDEIINVVDQKLVSRNIFLRLLKSMPQKTELILTGRGDISDIEKYADYVTVMIDRKHPFKKEINSRRGIEY